MSFLRSRDACESSVRVAPGDTNRQPSASSSTRVNTRVRSRLAGSGRCQCPHQPEEALMAEAPETPGEPDAPAETEDEAQDQTAAGRQPQQLSGEGAQDRGDAEAEEESA